jgi:hypothetical protein
MRIKKELIEKIEGLTMVDYGIVKDEEIGCLIPVENIEAVLEDMLLVYNELAEEYEDFKEEVEDNYIYKTSEPDAFDVWRESQWQ